MTRRWPLLGLLAAATLSCQIILGLEEPTGTPQGAPPPEEEDSGAKDPCKHALVPPRPTKDDDVDTKNAYWFAAQHVEAPVKQPASGKPRGFDLDRSCTCEADLKDGAPSCVVAGGGQCDLANGIDDAFAALAAAADLPAFGIDPAKPVNDNLVGGSKSVLLYLSDYNGKPNDTDVGVQLINSGGLYTRQGCDGNERPLALTLPAGDPRNPPGQNRYAPAFDGCDRWSPEPNVTVGSYPNRAATLPLRGWVANNQLVLEFHEIGASVFGNHSRIQNGLTVATISQENGHFRLEGLLVGRMPFQDLVQAVGGNQSGDGDEDGGYVPACKQPYWLLAGPKLCAARDIMSTQPEDFRGKTCDAVSVAIGYTMVAAEVSDLEWAHPGVDQTCDPINCP